VSSDPKEKNVDPCKNHGNVVKVSKVHNPTNDVGKSYVGFKKIVVV